MSAMLCAALYPNVVQVGIVPLYVIQVKNRKPNRSMKHSHLMSCRYELLKGLTRRRARE